MKVVVVDDEVLAREELCYQLGQLGTEEVVAQAGNGLEAIAAVERHDPDLARRRKLEALLGRDPDEADELTIESLVADAQLLGESAVNQVAVKVGERFLLVQADDIIYASLADESINIVTGHVTGSSNYRTLDDLQARLDPEVFWRVHRSHLVNINKIKEIVPWFSRNYILRMKDAKSTEIPVSRSQTKRLREYLKL